MKTLETIIVLNSLPINSDLSEKSSSAVTARIKLCARRLRKLNNQVEICSGSTGQGQRSYKRIYMEWAGNESHDPRHKKCNTIYFWEYETYNKYGFQPLSKKAIFELCAELEGCIRELKGKKNPLLKNSAIK